MGFLSPGRIHGKWAASPHTCLQAAPAWHEGGSKNLLPCTMDFSSLQGGWTQWGGSPWVHEPWKSLRRYKFLESWEWHRQSTPLSLKALIRLHSLQEWKSRYCSLLLAPGMGCWYSGWPQSWDKTFMIWGNLNHPWWCPSCSSRGLRDIVLFRMGAFLVPCVECRPRWPLGESHWRWSETTCWVHYSLVPQK